MECFFSIRIVFPTRYVQSRYKATKILDLIKVHHLLNIDTRYCINTRVLCTCKNATSSVLWRAEGLREAEHLAANCQLPPGQSESCASMEILIGAYPKPIGKPWENGGFMGVQRCFTVSRFFDWEPTIKILCMCVCDHPIYLMIAGDGAIQQMLWMFTIHELEIPTELDFPSGFSCSCARVLWMGGVILHFQEPDKSQGLCQGCCWRKHHQMQDALRIYNLKEICGNHG